MPLKSEAQRRFLNWRFGHNWTSQHHYDQKGKLPARATGRGGLLPVASGKNTVDAEKYRPLYDAICDLMPPKRPAKLPHKVGTVEGDVCIYLVDGNKIKLRRRKGGKNKKGDDDDTFMGFVEGGNGLEDPELCGHNDVYVDGLIDPECWAYIALHETVERAHMTKGMSYAKAHEIATAVEYVFRKEDT